MKYADQNKLRIEVNCPICKTSIEFTIRNGNEFDETEIESAKEELKHWHWCDIHRVCAVCGQYISTKNNELELDVYKEHQIHENYNDYYQRISPEDKKRKLLNVHKKCSTSRNN